MEFFIHHLIGLAEDRAALAVTEDHVLATDILEHRTTDLTGVGTFGLAVGILSPKTDVAPMERFAHFPQIHRGWAYSYIDVGGISQGFDQALHQS